MVWPPTTHQDVQDELGTLRAANPDYLRSGYYSIGIYTGMSSSTASIATGTIYARPFELRTRRAFDRLGINVATAATTGSGGLIQMALLQPGGVPGTILVETGTVSSETAGAKEWPITQTLNAGIWWVCVRTVVASCLVTAINSNESNTPWVSAATTPPTALGLFGGYTATASAGGAAAGFGVTGSWSPIQLCHLGCLRAA